MDREKLLEIVREASVGVLGVDPSTLTDDTHFANDLDADSLALVEIFMAVEDRLGLEVPESELADIHTVGAALDLLAGKVAA